MNGIERFVRILALFLAVTSMPLSFAEDAPSPFDEDAKFARIEKLRKESRFSDAKAEIEKCAKTGCDPDRLLSERAHLAFDIKDYKNAYLLYTKLIAKEVNPPLSRARRARVAHALRKNDIAIRDLTFLAEKNPANVPVKLFLGKVYFESKNFKSARKVYSEILAAHADRSEALLGIVRLDLVEGDRAAAVKKLMDLASIVGPDQAEAAQILVGIMKKDSLMKAGSFMKEYLERHPNEEWAYNQYALLLDEVKETDLAKEILVAGSRLSGAHGAWFNLALLEHRAGNEQRAIEIYKTIPTESPIYGFAQANLKSAMKTEAATAEIDVKPGDTLTAVSARAYGTPSRWQEIEAINRAKLKGKGGIMPGMRLKLVPGVPVRADQVSNPVPPSNRLVVRY